MRFTNRGGPCVLDGYADLSLADRSGRIPFVLRRTGDQMITGRPPRRFVVGPGGAAYLAVNKYRCDLGPIRTATALRIGPLILSLAAVPRELAWCGKGDPGSVVDATPFEPSVAATRR